ncbi:MULTISPECIES: tRNA (guanosine(46)-N7)-methyltransferase TrmB [Oleiagrimonas]|uniref:tRNA (guanine-N(7)-)-methyltransferase n=1 Tax=Oleiagrimonas citrea TaxID=1665687 RepID=A0A846ZPK8_9GAMM|nr:MULTISPECIES: tRNA (guanosine(46)-N7)-methyltransferase TrmB [Oleiagrimonas]NKZ39429.1 tRNA (guanosine(46)-N7)-methyltransferase TrmB [Oleiagrimonas citrea]RAP59593.1 tRNA (guanosine(46)-N7)-methyltransferase TrmB [Oleiagrimonas sp. MCCC 1A03011]
MTGSDPSSDHKDTDRRRPVRSFVLREGRITPAQQRAFDAHWARFGLDYKGQPRDLDAVFDRRAPRVLEIGFGNGEALAWAATHDPDRDYIGVEVHRPGVGRLMNALAEAEATNVRIYRHDAVEVLREEIAPESLDEVRVWFPDPWPKKRHHKRRLIQPDFVALIATRVRPGGLLHLATDWAEYAEHMIEVMEASSAWRNREGPGNVSERPAWRIETHFERRGLRLGHDVCDLIYERQ